MTVAQQEELLSIPLSDLVLSPRNARRTSSKTLDELAASIMSHGLLQNPVVIEQRNGKGKPTGSYEVVAGGRRLQALQQLAKQKKISTGHEITCKLVAHENAEEASTAENTVREAMHPADEFEAFRALVDKGHSAEEIAARFGVTPLAVQRRLKLANVAPELIEIYRAGEMSLDQLMALTISENHDKQRRVWSEADGWQRQPQCLRASLADNAIDARADNVAKFVGIDAYEAAGGRLARDLFADGGGYLEDPDLLHQLATAKLDAAAEQLREEGWSWVETRMNLDYSESASFGQSRPSKRDATADEAAAIEALRSHLDDLQTKIDAIENSGEEVPDQLCDEHDAVDQALEAATSALEYFSDRQKEKAGAIVTIAYGGTLEIRRGLIKPAAGKKKGRDLPPDTGNGEGDGTTPESEDRPLSETLCRRLTAHRTAAMQAILMERTDIALVVLAHKLTMEIIPGYELERLKTSTLNVSATTQLSQLRTWAPDLQNFNAVAAIEQNASAWAAALPKDGAELFAHLLALPQAELLQLIGCLVAQCVSTITAFERPNHHTASDLLASAIELDMADWWHATGDSYLAAVPKSRRMQAVREAVSEEAAAGIANMKKEPMIAAAKEHLAGTRWLPAILRLDGIGREQP